MKKAHLWHRAVLKSSSLAVAVILVYLLLFIQLMKMEQQYDHANVFDGIYWIVTTITTEGYGDIVFSSAAGKLFSVAVMISGIPLVFGILFTLVIFPWLERSIRSSLPTKAAKKLSEHIIICGYNPLVETLIEELNENEIPYVLIEEEQELVVGLLKKDIHTIYGIPYDEETLRNANIDSARFVIANRSDEMNANIVLTARNISDVKIIAMVEDRSNKKYLKYAGATSVVSPKELFGRFIGRKAADPFVSRLTGATEFFEGVSIIEFPIYPKSPLLGKTIRNAAIREKTGANIVGMWKVGSLSFNVRPEDTIRDNSVLLAIGTTEQLSKLRRLTQRME
ncbi:potassium channel protein [Methanolobus sp. ZRKC3]|uniref:potassium channel family protein n=1 Tax=Methanolobus sp. ZRKC3 TaxID=3125786 RepID=UPI00324861DD